MIPEDCPGHRGTSRSAEGRDDSQGGLAEGSSMVLQFFPAFAHNTHLHSLIRSKAKDEGCLQLKVTTAQGSAQPGPTQLFQSLGNQYLLKLALGTGT